MHDYCMNSTKIIKKIMITGKNRVTFVVVEIPDYCATPEKYRRSNTAKHVLLQQIMCSL